MKNKRVQHIRRNYPYNNSLWYQGNLVDSEYCGYWESYFYDGEPKDMEYYAK